MPATADQLIPTPYDVLASALERGVTGRLSRGGRRGTVRQVYVMQGQILAAHGPDDGPWVVRRLVNSGALTERQGKAFIRRLSRGTPFEELLRGHVPDNLLADLLSGRFRQNLLDFLSSPPPIDFQPMDTVFVANIQSGHDSSQLLRQTMELRDRIGPLMRHRGPLTLRPGPSMPSSRVEARLVDLCESPISLRNLLTFAPFEAGETLDHVLSMLENGAIVSDEGIRLPRTRGHGPATDYAVEELFSLGTPATDEDRGTPASPIEPEHLALLREGVERAVEEDFGTVPEAFRAPRAASESEVVPEVNTSHLVLVNDAPSEPPPEASGPNTEDEAAEHRSPVDDSLSPPSGDFAADVLTGVEHPDEPETPNRVEDVPEPASKKMLDPRAPQEDATDDDTAPTVNESTEPVPESWRDLSGLSFGAMSSRLDTDEPPATPLSATPPPISDAEVQTAPIPRVVPAEPVTVFEEPTVDQGNLGALEPSGNGIDEATEALPASSSLDAPSEGHYPSTFTPDAPTEESAPRVDPAPPASQAEALPPPAIPATDDSGGIFDDAPDVFTENAIFQPQSLAQSPADAVLDPPSFPNLDNPPPVDPVDPVHFPIEDSLMGAADDSLMDAADDRAMDEADDRSMDQAEAPESSPAEPSNALVDAARRYLEEAQQQRKDRNKRPIRPEVDPEPVTAYTGEKKLTGFDFHVDDAELALFDDHDRYRGGGGGQFTLNKNLLDKVELLPETVPERVQLGQRPTPDLPEEESLIEMGEASAEEEAEAGVVALAFSAPKLDADQVLYKIAVAGEVALAVSKQLDAHVGPGVGQTTIQLLVEATTGPYGRLFHQVVVHADGSFDEDRVFANLEQRPELERRSLLDRGLKDFIERALSTAAMELSDEALDSLLADVAGYQQRLRM